MPTYQGSWSHGKELKIYKCKYIYYIVQCALIGHWKPGPMGLGIAGALWVLTAVFFTSAVPAVPWNSKGFDFMPKLAMKGRGFSGIFGRTLIIRMSPQCWADIQALQRDKSIALLFPGPEKPVVTSNWCTK